MKSMSFFLFFSFLFIKTVGQGQFYPTVSPLMSTLYRIDSASFRVSTDNGDSFGEWEAWPNKFNNIAIENIDSAIIIADTRNKVAARYKYFNIKEFDNPSSNIYYGIIYKCLTDTKVPSKVEFLHYAGYTYQIFVESYTPPLIFDIKYFVKFGWYYKDKWIDSMVKK
jgi:hypothetical protein